VKLHPQSTLQSPRAATIIGRYRRNNWPIPIIGKTADNRPIIGASLVVIATAAVLVRHHRRHPCLSSTTVIRHYVKNPHLRILPITSTDFLRKICLQFTHCNIRTSTYPHIRILPSVRAASYRASHLIKVRDCWWQCWQLVYRSSACLPPPPTVTRPGVRTFLPMDISPHGHFAPWKDISPHRRFAPWVFCPMDVLPQRLFDLEVIRPKEDSPHGRC